VKNHWKEQFSSDFQTTVEDRFTPNGDATIVDFEHRDLERFDNVKPSRGNYESGVEGGWAQLLAGYQALAEAA
jgi:hypothetical protein